MDNDPDYSKYTLDELLDASRNINREKYSERAQRLDEEISRRRKEVEEIALSEEKQMQQQELPLEFNGSAREYFRIWIVNLCLTLLSLGIFSAWAKVRKKRYSYSHTTIGGTPFQYLGQPIPILKGRLIAAVGFLVYYISSHFFTSLLPWVLGAGLIVAPWVIVRSAAFNARYSAFRNMTFHFDAGYLDALKVLYAWGIIPVLVIGIIFSWQGQPFVVGIASLAFTFSFPWWLRRIKKFLIEHTFYGGKNGVFLATGGQYFKVYFVSGLILLGFAIPLMIFLGIVFSQTKEISLFTYVAPIVIYAGYVMAFAYNRARSGNLIWNNTHLGSLRFQATFRFKDLVKLYVTNALGILASLGFLIPWAVMRTLKYRADNMRVWGTLDQFQGSEKSAVSAVGAETVDFFNVDLSL